MSVVDVLSCLSDLGTHMGPTAFYLSTEVYDCFACIAMLSLQSDIAQSYIGLCFHGPQFNLTMLLHHSEST